MAGLEADDLVAFREGSRIDAGLCPDNLVLMHDAFHARMASWESFFTITFISRSLDFRS